MSVVAERSEHASLAADSDSQENLPPNSAGAYKVELAPERWLEQNPQVAQEISQQDMVSISLPTSKRRKAQRVVGAYENRPKVRKTR
jgi:hypothetical protein